MANPSKSERDTDLLTAEKYLRFLHSVLRPLSPGQRDIFFAQINITRPGTKLWGSLTRYAEHLGVRVSGIQQQAAEGKRRLRRRFDPDYWKR